MDTYEAIKRRRSIRSFKPDPVDDSIIKRIMDAAIWAPSALNSQNWKFYVLKGEIRDQFAKLLTPIFERMKDTIMERYGPEGVEIRRKLYSNAGGAPVVVVCYIEEGSWDWDKTGPSMACQNLMLAATAEGLASLYIGSPKYVKDDVNKLLGENDAELLGAILLGYSDSEPEPPARIEGKVIYMES